jgi:SH2 domain
MLKTVQASSVYALPVYVRYAVSSARVSPAVVPAPRPVCALTQLLLMYEHAYTCTHLLCRADTGWSAYAGNMGRDEADALLSKRPQGTYMLRRRTPQQLVLCIAGERGRVQHVLINYEQV